MEDENKDLATIEEQANLQRLEDEKKAKREATKSNLTPEQQEASDKFVHNILVNYQNPALAEAMVNKDVFKEIYTDRYIDKYKDKAKAKAAMDKDYEIMSLDYQEKANEESKFKVLENISFMAEGMEGIEFVGEEYSPEIFIMPETISGRRQLLDNWTDPTRSVEQASLSSRKIIDSEGNLISYEDDAYDELAFNKEYTNKAGKKIIAFTYQPYSEYQRDPNLAIKAIYEGEIPTGEVVSRLDTMDSFLVGNGLDTSTWKVGVGSVFDFVIDVVDTLFALGQYKALGFTAGLIGDTEFYKDFVDNRTILSTWMTSKSKADKESMITFNNALSLGINIAGQLFTGKAIAKGMSKLIGAGFKAGEKIFAATTKLNKAKTIEALATTAPKMAGISKAAASKEVKKLEKILKIQEKTYNRKNNIVKGTTLMALGAMQAKATGDEAGALGFSHGEQAAIFFASLGSMMVANNLSDLGFDRLGLKAINPIMKKATKETVSGIKPTSGGIHKLFSKTKEITTTARFKLSTALSKTGLLPDAIREGTQEETEFIFDELVRHTATALSTLGYGAEAPKFKTMMDEGYWKEAGIESLLNFGVGSIAGGATSAIAGHYKTTTKPEDKLFKFKSGNAEEVYKKVAYYSTRTQQGAQWQSQLYKLFKDLRKKGAGGREDISTKWDSKLGRYKRTNELSTTDIAQGHTSQAEMQLKASMAQYEYYKHMYSHTTEGFDIIKENNPEFEFLMNSKTMYDETRALLEKKAELYLVSTSEGEIDFDSNLEDLQKEKDRIKTDAEGNEDRDAYNKKLNDLSKVTKLSTKDVEKLVEINRQLNDISSGKSLEESFIKFQTSSPKYKDNLPWDVLKKLLGGDKEAQDEFKELKKEFSKEQKENTKAINEHVDADGKISDLFTQILRSKQGGLILSNESRLKLIDAIDKLGIPLDDQKIRFYDKLFADLEAVTEESLTQGEKHITDTKETAKGEDVMNRLMVELRASQLKGSEAVRDTLANFNDISFLPTEANSKLLYILSKINTVAAISEVTGFGATQYDPNQKDAKGKNTSSKIFKDLNFFAQMTRSQKTGLEGLNDVLMTEESSIPGISDLIETTKDDFLDELDSERGLKRELNVTLSNSKVYDSKRKKQDLLYGFTKTNSGGIKGSNESLYAQHIRITTDATLDKNGEIEFFGNNDGALELASQIKVRLLEAEFLIEFLPTLAKIDSLNKKELNNDNPQTTFLTQYIEEYVTSFEEYKKNPAVVRSELLLIKAQLEAEKVKVDKLLALASTENEDLGNKYSTSAMVIAQKELTEIDRVIRGLVDEAPELVDEYMGDGNLFSQILDPIHNIESNLYNSKNKADIDTIYQIIYNTKRLLNEAYNKDKKGPSSDSIFMSRVLGGLGKVSSTSHDSFRSMLKYMLTPVDFIHNKINEIITQESELVEDDGELLLPTVEQIVWIEEMVSSAINKDFLKANSILGDKEKYTTGAFFSGGQGSGKSQIVLRYAATILDSMYRDINGPIIREIVLAAPSEDMRINMVKAIPEGTININENIKTQYDLYNLLVKSDTAKNMSHSDPIIAKAAATDLAQEFDKIGTIFIDEISLLEYSGQDVELSRKLPEKARVLNAILAQVEKINNVRTGTPLVIIGVGDAKQPGYIENDLSPKNEGKKSEKKLADVDSKHIFVHGNEVTTYISRNTLNHNFRSKVPGMSTNVNEVIAQLKHRNAMEVSPLKFLATTEQHLGIRTEIPEKQKVRTFNDIADDKVLMKDIENKLIAAIESGKDFSVAIVAGEGKEHRSVINNKVENTLLKTLMQNPKYEGYFKMYSLTGVQGSEADYVLAEIPDSFFVKQFTDRLTGSQDERKTYRHKLEILNTLLGRAYYFTDIAMNYEFDGLKSETSLLTKESKKENTSYKKDWKAKLLEAILKIDAETVKQQIPVPSGVGKVNETTVVQNKGNEPETLKSSHSGIKLTPEELNPIGNIVTPSKEVRTVTEKRLEDQIITRMEELLLIKYNGLITDVSLYTDYSAESMANIEAILQGMVKSNGTDKNRAQKFLIDLHNLKSDILGTDNKVFLDDEQKNKEVETKVEVESFKNEADGAIMRDIQDTEGMIVVYQDISSKYNPKSSETKRKQDYLEQVYSQVYSQAEATIHMRKALEYTTIDEQEGFTVNPEYGFAIVSYYGAGTRKYSNNIMVGFLKSDPDKKFMVGQLKADNLSPEDSKSKDPRVKSLRVTLQNRIKFLADNVNVLPLPNHILKEKDAIYIESEVSGEEVIVGLTVGNLVTEDARILEKITASALLEFDGDLELSTQGTRGDSKYVTNLKNAMGKDLSHDLVDYPFFTTKGKKGTSYIFMKSGKNYIVRVKTSKGEIAFIEKGSEWIPITGVGEDNTIYYGNKLIDEESTFYSKELHDISKVLSSSLDVNNDLLDENADAKYIKTVVNLGLGFKDSVFESIEKGKKSQNNLTLLREFKNKKTNILSEIKMSLKDAHKLLDKTSKRMRRSEPKIIMEGEHRGKGVIFYTFRTDVNANLDTMTSEELLVIYKAMLTTKNSITTKLTSNRLGIGMMLLDVKGKTLTEIMNNYPEDTLENVSSAHMNKIIMSGQSEDNFISILSSIRNKITGSLPSIIATQLSEKSIHSDQIDKWMRDNKEETGFELLTNFIEGIFEPEALGSLVVTHNVSANARAILYEIGLEKSKIDGTDAAQEEYTQAITELYDKNIGGEAFNDMGIIGNDRNIGIQKLMGLGLQTNNEANATGKLATDAKGNLLMHKAAYPVITAVNVALVESLVGEHQVIPKAKFNMAALISFLNSNKDKAPFNEAIALLDNLLVETGFSEGIYISPSVTSTTSMLADINDTVESDNYEFETDVKRIKQPSVVLNSRMLEEILIDDSINLTKEKKETKEAPSKEEKSFQETVEEKIITANFEDLNNIVDTISNKKGILSTQRKTLYEEVNLKFYEYTSLPEDVSINEIDFEKQFLTIPGTEEFIKSLNILRDISITPDLEVIIWDKLLKRPEQFTSSQHERLNALINNSMPNNLTDEENVEQLKTIYINTVDTKLPIAELIIEDQESADIFEQVAYLIEGFEYPIEYDTSPENRALLLIGANTLTSEEEDTPLFLKNKIKAFLTNKFNATFYPMKYLNTAIDFDTLSNEEKIEQELLGLFTELDVNAIMGYGSLLELDAKTINKALYRLYITEDYGNFRKVLSKLETDIEEIYYNSDIKELATTLIEVAVSKVEISEKDVIDTQLEKLKAESKTFTKEAKEMKEGAKIVKNILTNKKNTGLNKQDQGYLNNIIDSFNEENLNAIKEAYSGNLSPEESLIIEEQIADTVFRYNTLFGEDISVTSKINLTQGILEAVTKDKRICKK